MSVLLQFALSTLLVHIVIGCALVAAVSLILRALHCISFFTLNAATRHNIWLSLYLLLLVLPLLALINPTAVLPEQSLSTTFTATEQQVLPPAFPPRTVGQLTDAPGTTYLPNEQAAPATSHDTQIGYRNFLANLANAIAIPDGILLMLTVLLALTFSIKLVLFIRSLLKLDALIKNSRPAAMPMQQTVDSLAAQLGLNSSPELRVSTAVTTPSTGGFLSTWILLPEQLLLSKLDATAEQDLLIHELAHLKRRDHLTALLLAATSLMLFWHPASHFMSKKIKLEREVACDDWVVTFSAEDAKTKTQSYANTLVEIARDLGGGLPNPHSLAWLQSPRQLSWRVEQLLDQQTDHSEQSSSSTLASILIFALALSITLSPVWPRIPDTSNDTLLTRDLISQRLSELSIVEVKTLNLESDRAAIAIVDAEVEAENEKAADNPVPAVSDSQNTPAQRQANSSATAIAIEKPPTAVLQLSSAPVLNPIAALPSTESTDNSAIQDSGHLAPVDVTLQTRPATSSEHGGLAANRVLPEIEPLLSARELDALSRAELQATLRDLELQFYDVFNSHVSSNELKVYCGNYTPPDSFIPQHYCEPRFVADARSEETRRWLIHNKPPLGETAIMQTLEPQFQKLTRAMNAVYETDPAFQRLIITLRVLRGRLGDPA